MQHPDEAKRLTITKQSQSKKEEDLVPQPQKIFTKTHKQTNEKKIAKYEEYLSDLFPEKF